MEITHIEPIQESTLATYCQDTTTDKTCSVDSSEAADCANGESGNPVKDCILSMSTPKTEARLQEHDLGPLEDWVCLCSNRDYCQTEEERREQPVVSTQRLSLCDRSEGAQSEAERHSLSVRILPPAGCSKQTEETDRGKTVIRERLEATEGKETSEQEGESSTARRREEENNSESAKLITPCVDSKDLVMGQTSSSGASDCDTKECFQEGESTGKEEMILDQELADRPFLEGLPDPVSILGDAPSASLIDCGDVIRGPESAVPHLLIEGLHEGEPPPDINSLEQNQETAVMDYTTEWQWDFATETFCHSGNCSERESVKELDGEHAAQLPGYSPESGNLSPLYEADSTDDCHTAGNSMEDTGAELSPAMMNFSSRHVDPDSAMTCGLSSDDDCSFRSVGSSTIEIFQPIQDNVTMEMAEVSSAGFKSEEPEESKPDETNEHLQTLDPGCPSPGSQSEQQLSPNLNTMEALNAEETEKEPDPEPSKEEPLLGPESMDVLTVEVNESDSGEENDSKLNAEIVCCESEATVGLVLEAISSLAEKCDVISTSQGGHQPTDTDNNLQLVIEDLKNDNLEITLDERPPDGGLMPSEDVSLLSDTAEVLEVEPPSTNSEASREHSIEYQMIENSKTPDTVDGGSQSAIQGGQTFLSLIRVILVIDAHIHTHGAIHLS